MQHLHHILRELKSVSPREQYASWSRAEILATRPAVPAKITVASLFRGAGAFAMASLALIGGISLVRSVMPSAPTGDSPLNQQALSAEAETIATQLALADVQYQAISEDGETRTVNPTALSVAKSAAGSSGDAAVDRALEALSE
jgi:hypothetical protein